MMNVWQYCIAREYYRHKRLIEACQADCERATRLTIRLEPLIRRYEAAEEEANGKRPNHIEPGAAGV